MRKQEKPLETLSKSFISNGFSYSNWLFYF